MKYFVQVLLVKELEVEASDSLQAERAAYHALKREKDNAIGIHVFGEDSHHSPPATQGEGAMSDSNIQNMEFVRKYFGTLDVDWCSGEPL